MDNEDDLIPGIYNYCDQWCERCDFTVRCRTFAMEQEWNLEESDDPMGDTVRIVSHSLDEAKRMLLEKAEEFGIDLEAAMNDPEVELSMKRQHDYVYDNEIFQLSHAYSVDSTRDLENVEVWLPDGHENDEVVDDMVTILRRYAIFVSAKFHHALDARLDADGYEDPEQIADTQSDANGQIKIALILIERSLVAWNYLLRSTNAQIIQPKIVQLERIKDYMERTFPNAREFVRPGFDEIEAVM